jgi:hypothetical protein
MPAYIPLSAVCLLLIIITARLLSGRGAFLVAGFNTMPKEAKEKFDQPALCKFVGKVLIPFDALMIAIAVGTVIHAPWMAPVALIAAIGGLPYLIAVTVYANTGNRFRKKKGEEFS